MADGVIANGDYAVADENGEKKSIVLIRDSGSLRVGKVQVSTAPLVGAPWGSMWELVAGSNELERVTQMPSQLGPKVDEVDKDNSQLVDRNEDNQALKAEDIEELKRQGKAGADIVEALCSNSVTFDTKTEFAQDKYIKRKSKKYVLRVTLRRPTGRTLCETLFEKSNGQRTWNLRGDTLAAALSLANVGANSRVLVVESCQGLLAAACAERLGGAGNVCCAAAGDKRAPPIDCVRMMNFPEEVRAVVRTTTLAALSAARRAVVAAGGGDAATGEGGGAGPKPAAAAAAAAAAPGRAGSVGGGTNGVVGEVGVAGRDADEAAAMDMDDVYAAADAEALRGKGVGVGIVAAVVAEEQREEAAAAQQDQEQEQQQQQQQLEAEGREGQVPQGGAPPREAAAAAEEGEEGEEAAGPGDADEAQQQQQQQRHTYAASAELVQRLVQPGFTSCILASPKLHAASLLRQVLPLLAPSAAFVVYSPWQQPLAEAMQELQGSGLAVMLQLSESWMRQYQVLPGRTHPNMSMHGTGGYLLSGIKVIPSEDPAAAGGAGEGDGGRGGGRGGRGSRGGGRGRPPKRQRR